MRAVRHPLHLLLHAELNIGGITVEPGTQLTLPSVEEFGVYEPCTLDTLSRCVLPCVKHVHVGVAVQRADAAELAQLTEACQQGLLQHCIRLFLAPADNLRQHVMDALPAAPAEVAQPLLAAVGTAWPRGLALELWHCIVSPAVVQAMPGAATSIELE